jgi:hypothetical protein
MSGDENSGDGKGIEIVLTEAPEDDGAGVADIGFGDLFGGEGLSDGNRAVEVVGVGGAEAGNFASGLRPGGGELRVGVDDAANGGEFAIEEGVGVEIARWAQVAFDDFSIEIGDDHVRGGERAVVDATGLDDTERLGTGSVDSAGVAEGVRSEAAAGDFKVGVEDLFAKRFEEHGDFPGRGSARDKFD